MKLGILGGGQLARMLALAAHPLGIKTICLDPNSEACAQQVTSLIQGDYCENENLAKFLKQVDLVTYETENIPSAVLEKINQTHQVFPSVETLKITQDRLYEKNFFQDLCIPTADFADINSEHILHQSIENFGFPSILKTRRMGYDGKGQIILKDKTNLSSTWSQWQNTALILEEFINFQYEVSLIAVRNVIGETAFYPLVRNYHENGILRWSEAPFHNSDLQQQAQNYALKILSKLNYVGVLTIEFFFDGQKLLANEIAPRVHNSGHWTIEGTQTSQFENHLRAIFNLPLGSTLPNGESFMMNCLGTMPALNEAIAIPGVHYHIYGKTEKPLRKIGHVTLVDNDQKRFITNKQALKRLFETSYCER